MASFIWSLLFLESAQPKTRKEEQSNRNANWQCDDKFQKAFKVCPTKNTQDKSCGDSNEVDSKEFFQASYCAEHWKNEVVNQPMELVWIRRRLPRFRGTIPLGPRSVSRKTIFIVIHLHTPFNRSGYETFIAKVKTVELGIELHRGKEPRKKAD
ncbi:hypothetical protein H6F89_34340 [Cyanobacteria bacterium FACHB-63]|nr:hypothetical protein [Cyanobacteria bacterium FACHB-63]